MPDNPTLLPQPIQAGWYQGWTLAFPHGSALESPAIYDGVVFVGGGATSRDLYALDAVTGIPLWTVRLSDAGPGRPVTSDRYVVVRARGRAVFVLSAFDGTLRWSRRFDGPPMGDPAIVGDLVHFGDWKADEPGLAAHSLHTGARLWRVPLDGPVLGAPSLREDVAYVTTTEGTVYCVDIDTGRERWSEPLGAWTPPRIDGANLLLACANPWALSDDPDDPGLLMVTLSAGLPWERVLWGPREAGDRVLLSRLPMGRGFSGVPAASYLVESNDRWEAAGTGLVESASRSAASARQPWTSGDHVCTTRADSLRCADLRTGVIQWEWTPPDDRGPSTISAAPALAGDLLIVVTSTGDLAGLSRRTGETAWILRLSEPAGSQPVIHQGWVYITTLSGRIFGVDLQKPHTN